ncbi:MAG TPA: hypothetical protein PKB02_05405 [Anaerohalosphaeraceae bacterium]|nr:hypothetical protein [Anaerohalosphaeraceae bacterium]
MFKKRRRLGVVLIVIAGIVAYFPLKKAIQANASRNELAQKKETFSGNSDDLKHTAVLPAFDSPLQPDKNNIWCSSFQLAWNEMKDTVIKEPLQVVGAEALCVQLNSGRQTKNDLLPESYYAIAGNVSDGIIQTIQTDMASRFPTVPILQFNPDDQYIAYAYLETYIQFTKAFLEVAEPLLFHGASGKTTPVKSFGIQDGFLKEHEPLCKQVDVLYCKLDDQYKAAEYALDLCRDTQPYQIVVAVTEKKDTLGSTYNQLQDKIEDFPTHKDYEWLARFQDNDILRVPEMFWTLTHRFKELEGAPLTNANAAGMPISAAIQQICFRLDRAGVTLKSSSLMCVSAMPRDFIFDKPFLLYLKKRDASQPFFVMWVDNAELLTPF